MKHLMTPPDTACASCPSRRIVPYRVDSRTPGKQLDEKERTTMDAMDIIRVPKGTRVDGTDGPLGTFAGTRAATDSHAQEYVLVRLARLLSLRRSTHLVPLAWVLSVSRETERVILSATRAEVAGCPVLRADAAIKEDVDEALSGAGGFFRVPTIRASVVDGIVQLAGHSPNRTAARQAVEHAGMVRGVLAVQDRSFEDGALTIAVAQALTQDAGTRAAHLLVTSRLGEIGLNGTVPSGEVKEQATALARAVPGVTEVHNDAVIRAAKQVA